MQCPQYANATCCNGIQNNALWGNFLGIVAGFQSLGGNGACVHNVEALWCAFTCSPYQDQFIQINGYENMTGTNGMCARRVHGDWCCVRFPGTD